MNFTDTINNPIFREMQKDYNRAIAQKIRNRLQQLENANDKDKRRWIWELLQNANDTVKDRQVNIEINVTNEYIEFRHNGGYFSPRNITNLVHQISSKEGEESIGRFGTGFLTTHTLSRTIDVSGVFFENDNYSKFEITLYRTENTEQGLVKCIEKTWDEFKEIKLEEKPKEIVWTSFKYTNHNRKIAEDTINDFTTFIHYNLAYVQSIGSITVNNHLTNHNFHIERKDIQPINDILSIILFEGKINNQPFKKQLLFADNKEIQGAIEINNIDNKVIIEPIASNIPRLFCAFPLVGTETFLFPMVLNSRKFLPKTERDGLYLKGETTQTKRNKPLLKSALLLYQSTLKYLTGKQAENLYLLAQNENPFKDDYFDIEWYKKDIQKSIQNTILNSPIVKTETGNFAILRTVRFPYYAINNQLNLSTTKQIWEFQSVLYPNLIPQKSDIEHWTNLLWESCTKVDLENVALFIQNRGNVQNLKNQFVNKEIDAFTWLDNLIDFYIKNARLLLDKYRIIPNQRGVFCLKKDLYFDNNIPDILKDVYQILGEDWRSKLLNLSVKSLNNLLKSERKIYHVGTIVNGINSKIELKKVSENNIRNAIFKLNTVLPTSTENNYSYRKSLYQYSKDLYKSQIEENVEIKNLPINLWKAADVWLLHHIAKTIQGQQSMNNLSKLLSKENTSEGFEWLNSFFVFLVTKTGTLGRNIINEYAIIPNQKNFFKHKKDISLDQNIPNELKDIYNIFGENWYNRLLSLSINAFDNLFRTERKVLYVNNIIQGINSKIGHKDSNKIQVKQAVFSLSRLIPTENSNIEQAEYKDYRKELHKFSKDLFKDNIPTIIELENLPNQTWTSSDEWLLKHIIETIENCKNTNTLNNLLYAANGDNAVLWLNDFYVFCIKRDKTFYLTNKIYPNQLGELNFKSPLRKDEKIAEELKDILESLDKALSIEGRNGWRHLLLDNKITAFDETLKLQAKTTKDISDEINKKIPNLKTHPSNALKLTIFKLVTLMKVENKHQRKLWEYLRTFYLDEVPKQLQLIENTEDFDWKPCFLWSMERLIKDITALKYVDELEDELHGNKPILDWLAEFIEFVHETEDYKRLLDGDEYAVIPNQNGSFQIKSRLWLDDEIDEDLKKIIRLLNPVWLDDLVENKPIFVELPSDRVQTTVKAALEVDRIFRTYNDDPQKAEYVEAIRIISDWMYKGDEAFNKQYLDWVYNKEAELVVATLGSRQKKDEVLQIIQSGKAPILSKIANNSNFSEEDLEIFNNNPEKVKHLIQAIRNPPKSNPNPIIQQSTNDKIKEKTGGLVNSVEKLIEEFNKLNQKILKEERTKPKFIVRTETKGGTTDWDAVKRSNELARERIRKHIGGIKENNQVVYDISGWTRTSNTIIKNIKKNGIHIGLVTKGADNGIIYFNSSEREFLSDTKKFTELWVHSNGEIFQITLGEILKIWNVQSIKTNMFDL